MTSSVPAPARALLQELCSAPADTDLPALRAAVTAHADEIRTAARRNELLPLDVAEALSAALDLLLARVEALPPEQGALVVGAARYFCAENDHIRDVSGVLGLDDDVAVFNHVVRRIGRAELALEY